MVKPPKYGIITTSNHVGGIMKEKEFLELLATKFEMQPKIAANFIASYHEVLKEALKSHGEVTTAIGKYKLNHKPAGEARNPFSGETVSVPAKTVVKFAPNKKLKDEMINVKIASKK